MKYANDPLKYWLAIVNKILKYATEIMKYADDPLKYPLTIVNKEIPAKYKALFTLHINKFLYRRRQCCEVQHILGRYKSILVQNVVRVTGSTGVYGQNSSTV